MTQPEIKALLEKYWQAETTLEEERQLAEYFRRPDIDPALESFRPMFAWMAEESQLTPVEGFDSRMLQRIGSAEQHIGSAEQRIGSAEQRIAPTRSIRPAFSYAVAAAVILCMAISFLVSIGPGNKPSPATAITVPSTPRETQIKDTYDDPQKALAAVRHALLIASVRINQGRHITQKNIARLHNSWQAATGD